MAFHPAKPVPGWAGEESSLRQHYLEQVQRVCRAPARHSQPLRRHTSPPVGSPVTYSDGKPPGSQGQGVGTRRGLSSPQQRPTAMRRLLQIEIFRFQFAIPRKAQELYP